MDAFAIGLELGRILFENDIEIDLGRDGLTSGTGDDFVNGIPEWQTDVVDMSHILLRKSAGN